MSEKKLNSDWENPFDECEETAYVKPKTFPDPFLCGGIENAGKVPQVDEKGYITKFVEPGSGGSDINDYVKTINKETTTANLISIVGKEVVNGVEQDYSLVGIASDVYVNNQITKQTILTVTEATIENNLVIPILTLEQFNDILDKKYYAVYLNCEINDTKYLITYNIQNTRDGANIATPTLNDYITLNYSTPIYDLDIVYEISNNNVVYKIKPHVISITNGTKTATIDQYGTANINNLLIEPIVTNSNFNNNQFFRKDGSSDVKKMILSSSIVPELVVAGYTDNYSYAEIFYIDDSISTLSCNTNLYRPKTSGWTFAALAQKWNTTIGQISTDWSGVPISTEVSLNTTFGECFVEWEEGSTLTPIWVRFDENGDVLEISLTELTPSTIKTNLYYKDKNNNKILLQNEIHQYIQSYKITYFDISQYPNIYCSVNFFTPTNTTMTYSDIAIWLYNNGFNNKQCVYSMTSGINNSTTNYVATSSGGSTTKAVSIVSIPIGIYSDDGINIYLVYNYGSTTILGDLGVATEGKVISHMKTIQIL